MEILNSSKEQLEQQSGFQKTAPNPEQQEIIELREKLHWVA